MSPAGRPVPSRVFWARRLAVLGVTGAIVLLGVVLLGPRLLSGSQASSPTAQQPSPTVISSSATPKPRKHKKKTASSPTSATPQGPCDVSTLVVTPLVPEATAGGKVTVALAFTTTASTSCTFQISAESLVARVTRGDTRIWSTQDCPDAIVDQVVEAGPRTPGIARLVWNGRKSSTGCSAKAAYAASGSYLFQAAAYGSPAGQTKFQLAAPKTQTSSPSPAP